MKFALVLPDGAADRPLEIYGGQTVIEAAHTPHMDWIASQGRQGTVQTVPDGFAPGSDVATLSLLGYDPRRYHTGRAPLEAVAHDIELGPRDVVFRCNLVTVASGLMADFTAGHIAQAEAHRLIADLNACFADQPVTFHEGVQYRHLLVWHDAGDLKCDCVPPHDIPDQPIRDHLPRGRDAAAVTAIMEKARAVLAGHDVNTVRNDLMENPATDIWLWGQGRLGPFDPLTKRTGFTIASIAAVDLIRGITRLAGCTAIEVPGATGFLDTNYAGKGAAAVAALADYDGVCVHIEAPDEAGHLGDAAAKREAIEQIDAHIVGPLLAHLQQFPTWKILVAPDHPTPVDTRIHDSTAPPFCIAGTGVDPVHGRPFGERHAATSGLHIDPGFELLDFFLRR